VRLLMFHTWHLLWEVLRLAAYDYLSFRRSAARELSALRQPQCLKVEGFDFKGERQGHACAAECLHAAGPLFDTLREFCVAQGGAERNRGRVEGGAVVLCLLCLTFTLFGCCWINRHKDGADDMGTTSGGTSSAGGSTCSSSDGEAERARTRARARSFSG